MLMTGCRLGGRKGRGGSKNVMEVQAQRQGIRSRALMKSMAMRAKHKTEDIQ